MKKATLCVLKTNRPGTKLGPKTLKTTFCKPKP